MPVDVVELVPTNGRGKAAIRHLAMYMRFAAPSEGGNGLGISKTEAKAAVSKAAKLDPKTVGYAWDALQLPSVNRLAVAAGSTVRGAMVWNARPDDPRPGS